MFMCTYAPNFKFFVLCDNICYTKLFCVTLTFQLAVSNILFMNKKNTWLPFSIKLLNDLSRSRLVQSVLNFLNKHK